MSDYALEGSDYERLQRENERLKAALRDIANANGDECHVMSSLRFIEGYHEGVQEQAKRARHALGEGEPPECPANLLLDIIERTKAALTEIANMGDCKEIIARDEYARGFNEGRIRPRKVAQQALEAQNAEKGGE